MFFLKHQLSYFTNIKNYSNIIHKKKEKKHFQTYFINTKLHWSFLSVTVHVAIIHHVANWKSSSIPVEWYYRIMLMSFSLFKDGGIMKGVRQEGNGKHENCAECYHITHSNMKNNNRSCALKTRFCLYRPNFILQKNRSDGRLTTLNITRVRRKILETENSY